MADNDETPPPLESDNDDLHEGEEEIEEGQEVEFSSSSALPASPSKTNSLKESAATPSNTPVVSLFSKVPQAAQNKRSYEGDMKVNELLGNLKVSDKKAPAAADPEDFDDDDDEGDEDYEEGDEEEEDQYIATAEQIEKALPLLRENQSKIDDLKTKYYEARRELEIKFENLRKEMLGERAMLVRGDEDSSPALPGFWLDAMQRSMLLAQFVEEHDEACLTFLDNVVCSELKDDFGFKLDFHFAENPFFSNKVLSKTLVIPNLYSADIDLMPDVMQSIGSKINWLPEKNLTVKIEIKEAKRASRPKAGKKGGVKEIRQEVPQESFFSFFETREDKTPEEIEKMNQDEQDEYQREWETDLAIASTFRCKLIPDAVLWYTGEASDSDAYDDDEDEEEEEEDEDEEDDEGEEAQFEELDEDDEDDEDEDEEPEDNVKTKKKGGKPVGGAAKTEGGEEKCPQQ